MPLPHGPDERLVNAYITQITALAASAQSGQSVAADILRAVEEASKDLSSSQFEARDLEWMAEQLTLLSSAVPGQSWGQEAFVYAANLVRDRIQVLRKSGGA